jgi:threonine aldolase
VDVSANARARLRLVTHLDVCAEDVDRVVALFEKVLAG